MDPLVVVENLRPKEYCLKAFSNGALDFTCCFKMPSLYINFDSVVKGRQLLDILVASPPIPPQVDEGVGLASFLGA
jgi:hypothetical protein